MHILVTNDDGVLAPGLLALTHAMREIADKVTVLAPDRNWSASGHVKTLHRPLRIIEVELEDGSLAWATDGAPSDCVALAQLGFITEKIDLVVSGINPNANIGHDVTYSGTVTAAMEAAIGGIPGVAVSLDKPDKLSGPVDFSGASRAAQRVVQWLSQQNGLPAEMILSVNVPWTGREFSRIRSPAGAANYRDNWAGDRKVGYYWIGGSTDAIDEPGPIRALAADMFL